MTLPDLTGLDARQLAAASDAAAEAARRADMAYEQFIVERLRRRILTVTPGAARVTFDTDQMDDGVYLLVGKVFDADGREIDSEPLACDSPSGPDDTSDTVSGLLDHLSPLWGAYAGEFLVAAPARDLGDDTEPVSALVTATLAA